MKKQAKRIICSLLIVLAISAQLTGAALAVSLNDFTDVDGWYNDAVEYCLENGVFVGVSDDKFAPNSVMTRAMFATAMGRFAESFGKEINWDDYSGESPFVDVQEGAWYAGYVNWAASEKLAFGYDMKFSPDDPVTREQLTIFACHFAEYMGFELITSDVIPIEGEDTRPSLASFMGFDDSEDISEDAKLSALFARVNRLINGDGNNRLRPKDALLRAEACQYFLNLGNRLAGEN